jgi:hypothetical protein
LVEDPSLDDTTLPELRHGTERVIDQDTPSVSSHRLRHWKTREWKRRSNDRRHRAELEHRPPEDHP